MVVKNTNQDLKRNYLNCSPYRGEADESQPAIPSGLKAIHGELRFLRNHFGWMHFIRWSLIIVKQPHIDKGAEDKIITTKINWKIYEFIFKL